MNPDALIATSTLPSPVELIAEHDHADRLTFPTGGVLFRRGEMMQRCMPSTETGGAVRPARWAAALQPRRGVLFEDLGRSGSITAARPVR
jgi:hypothetical protein